MRGGEGDADLKTYRFSARKKTQEYDFYRKVICAFLSLSEAKIQFQKEKHTIESFKKVLILYAC